MAIETAAVGVWDWMPEKGTLQFNDCSYTMAGYSPGEFPETIEEWEKRVHPHELSAIREKLFQLKRGEIDSGQGEFRFKTGSGGWIWILGKGRVFQRDASGRPTRIIGTHIDITDLRDAESDRRRIQARFEQVVMESHAGIMIAQDGIIRYANPSLLEITGYAEGELTDQRQKNFRPLLHHEA